MTTDVAMDEPDPAVLTDEKVDSAVVMFGLLADRTRLRIVSRLGSGETDVASLAAAAGCSQTAASQHLARLRLAGLVAGEREGRRVVYRLRNDRLRRILAASFAPNLATTEPGGPSAADRGAADAGHRP